MSRFAVEVLHGHPDGTPLFLQLHYQPPHWPYTPGAAFDQFTDPSYDGPIRPDTLLETSTSRSEWLEGEDLEHLIGLYDGNLLRVDAAVGELFAALKETGRWTNSLIVITSDHGEAFMEHGQQGHNSSLFDEMLHVPLIVRLPQGEMPAKADTDRLASLLDVVPTILGRVGGTPAAEVDGIDLVNASPDPRRPRVLFLRRRNDQMLGTRTPIWKAILSRRSPVQRLFRVGSEPDERINRVAEHPLIFAGLGLRMKHHLEMTSGRGFSGEAVELTREADEALRALGYLD